LTTTESLTERTMMRKRRRNPNRRRIRENDAICRSNVPQTFNNAHQHYTQAV
jgi:hypothetical protein